MGGRPGPSRASLGRLAWLGWQLGSARGQTAEQLLGINPEAAGLTHEEILEVEQLAEKWGLVMRTMGRASSSDLEALERCPPRPDSLLQPDGVTPVVGVGRWPRPRRVFVGLMVGDYDQDHLWAHVFENADLVHKFIVVEGDHTFQGLYRRQLLPVLLESGPLSAYREKIVAKVLRFLPGECRRDHWLCEVAQRNEILNSARAAGLEAGRDVLLVGDSDEIPSREVVAAAARCDFGPEPVFVRIPLHMYSLKWEYAVTEAMMSGPAEYWLAPGAPSLDDTRRQRMHTFSFRVLVGPNNGWHLSYFGGVGLVQKKISSFAHDEVNQEAYTGKKFIYENMAEGYDPFRRGPLVGTVNPFRPRAVGAFRAFDCWVNSISPTCRDPAEIASVATRDCLSRYLSAGLYAASGPSTNALQHARHRWCRSSPEEPTAFLRFRPRLEGYLSRLHTASDSLRSYARAKSGTAWDLCVPVGCLGDAQEVLALAARAFLDAYGSQLAAPDPEARALPPWRSQDVAVEIRLPLRARGRPTPLALMPGFRGGSPLERRLVLASVGGEAWQVRTALHVFLGSLRRSQVAARVAVVTFGGDAAVECAGVEAAYRGVDCVPAGSLKAADGDAARGLAPAEPEPAEWERWLLWERYLQTDASSAVEVMLCELRDVLFQADPFVDWRTTPLHRPSASPGVLLAAERTDVLVGDHAWLRGNCSECAQLRGWPGDACEAVEGFPILNSGIALGARDDLLDFLSTWNSHLRAGGSRCDAAALLNALVWGSWPQSSARPVAAAAESGAVCAAGAGQTLRVDAGGLVLNHVGRPCAVVVGFRSYPELYQMALHHVPAAWTPPDAVRPPPRPPLWAHHGMATGWVERHHRGPHCRSAYRLLPPRNSSGCAAAP